MIDTAHANPTCDFIHSGFSLFYEDYNQPFYEQKLSYKELNSFPISLYTGEYRIQPSSIMVTQKLYVTINGFDENYRSVEDINFYFKSSEKGFKFKDGLAIVPEMPDRIIAATAQSLGLPLVTRDCRIQNLSALVTIW